MSLDRLGYHLVPLRTPTIPPATHTSAVLVGRRRALLLDPGSPWPEEHRRLVDAVREHGRRGGRVVGVLLTHHHPDHVGGAARAARELRLPVMAHPRTLTRLRGCEGLELRAVDDGHTLRPDDHPVTLLHTPGHAAGHLCLWDPTHRVLVAGDMLSGHGTVVIDPPEGEMARYLGQLERLRALDPRWLVPSHGDPVLGGARALTRLLAHRRWREWRVLMAVEPPGRDLWAITAEAYADTPPLSWPLASRSALAHLLKLEAEGRVCRGPGDTWLPRTDPSGSLSALATGPTSGVSRPPSTC